MTRNHSNRYLATGLVALSLLAAVPSIAGEREPGAGSRDRETTSWALPSQSMRDVAREKAAKKEAEEAAARSEEASARSTEDKEETSTE